MNKIVFYCWLLLISIPLAAQNQSTDKFHLQLDRSAYVAGETVWFKAYILTDFYPTVSKTSLSIDLLDSSGKPIASKVLPIFGGTAAGNIDLPISAPGGIYFLGLRHPLKQGTIYTKMLYVFNPSSSTESLPAKLPKKQDISFYTSSMSLVQGITNTVYFKASDEHGFPAAVEGALLNSNKEPILKFDGVYNGKGKFDFVPARNEKYSAEIKFKNGQSQVKELPLVSETGVIVSASDVAKGKRISIQSVGKEQSLNIVGLMATDIIFQKTFSATGNYSFILPTQELLTGLLRIFVYDASTILATTTSFVSTGTAALPIRLSTNASESSGDNQAFTIDFPDSTIGSFAVSVTNFDTEFQFSRNEIAADLLVDQHHPETIIAQTANAGIFGFDQKLLELYAATTDWQPIGLKELLAPALTTAVYDTNFLTIRGKVYRKHQDVLVKKGEVNFIFHGADSTTSFLSSPINPDGSIELPNLIFYDTSIVNYELNGKNKDAIVIKLEQQQRDSSRVSASYLRHLQEARSFNLPAEQVTAQAKIAYQYFTDADKRSTTLAEVKVTAKRGTPTQQVNDRYTRGVFQNSNMARSLDLINNPPAMTGGNILDYLQGKFPGLIITKNGANYTISSQRQLSLSNTPPFKFFLNEQDVTLEFLIPIQVQEVALVKYYSPGSSLPGIGIAGALVVYTKKPSEMSFPTSSRINTFKYAGYSANKDFETEQEIVGATQTFVPTTLYWNPNISVDGEKSSQTFTVKRYKGVKRMQVVIEGFTADGRILHFEKILDQ
ncbi:MAG: MG2 domain-containing protein [Bacteroidota bacterium]